MGDNDDGPLGVFRRAVLSWPTAALISEARQMYSDGRRTGSTQAVVNAIALVEYAAELRAPADVARLVSELAADSATRDMTRLVLDTAAAQRSVADLEEMTGTLADHDLPDLAGMLLAAVVLRRMPRDIAELLEVLLENGREMLVTELSADRTPGECRLWVVFWLRARGNGELAKQAARQMATRLSTVGRTELVRGLLTQLDTEIADAVIESVPGPDPEELAALTLGLRKSEPDGTQYATHVINTALTRFDLVSLLTIASLLGDGGWAEGARLIWARTIPGTPEKTIIDVLALWAERTGNPAAGEEPLRQAALTRAIHADPGSGVAELAIQACGRVRDGEFTVLRTVAENRPVPEIFDLADQLDHRGRRDLSGILIDAAVNLVHGRGDCDEVAQFIDLLLARTSDTILARATRRRRLTRGSQVPDSVRGILENVARQRTPERLIALIDGLERRGRPGYSRYGELHKAAEAVLAEHYTGTELAQLPLIRRLDHLPAVLEIEKKALETERETIPARQFPGIMQALSCAGAQNTDLMLLLFHIGAKNRGRNQIASAFDDAGMPQAAEYVRNGPRNVPLYELRFYPRQR